MNTDPRIVKTMLQLQLAPNLELLSGGSATASDPANDGVFQSLLQQMLQDGHNPSFTRREEVAGVPLPLKLLSAYQGIATLSGAANANDISSVRAAGVPADLESVIGNAAHKHGVHPSLIKAVIHTESSFNPNAVSHAGAKGLMQLMDGTARGLGVKDSFDPAQNIEGGTRFLAYLISKYDGNVKAALAAYNAGPGRVDRAGIRTDEDFERLKHTLPKETQNYVGKVLAAVSRYPGGTLE